MCWLIKVFVLSCVFYFSQLYALPWSGTISSNVTWTPSDTIIVLGELNVTSGAVLTIEAGTIIKRADTSTTVPKIIVRGNAGIRAMGAAGNLILFISVSITFEGITRDSINRIQYCSFRKNWGQASIFFNNPADLPVFPNVFIDHCTFNTSTYCTFDTAAAGMFIHGGKKVAVLYSTFKNVSCGIVTASISSGLMPWEPGITKVDHCTFYTITGTRVNAVAPANGYGICTVNFPCSLTVSNSIFHTMDHSGIRDYSVEDQNFLSPWVINNDFNCFYNCTDSACRSVTMGLNNIVQDPLFANEANGDFSIAANSPCWQAGSDGKNIGAWQGGVGINDNKDPYKGLLNKWQHNLPDIMVNINGTTITRAQASTGIYFIINKDSPEIQKKLIIK